MRGLSLGYVKANCEELLTVVRANYAKHQTLYAELYGLYQARAIKALEDRLEEIRTSRATDEAVSLRFQLEPPDDHRPDYRRAIGMLELHLHAGQPTVDLSAELYAAFMQDIWGWEEDFWLKNVTMYGRSRR